MPCIRARPAGDVHDGLFDHGVTHALGKSAGGIRDTPGRGEDIAETRMAFGLEGRPYDDSIAEQVILFFVACPDLVALRAPMRAELPCVNPPDPLLQVQANCKQRIHVIVVSWC
jgi:hypothetical protein